MSIEFKKNGIVLSDYITEYRQEPDGSIWAPIFRHANPASQLFSSGDTFSTGVYKNNGLWLNFNICKSLTAWEFLYTQQDTANSTILKFRWIQSKSPFNAVYEDVAPNAVTRITTAGYTDGGYGGYYLMNGATYMCIPDGSKGDWWGGTGCIQSYQGGIPGYPTHVCTTGEINAYVRIDNISGTSILTAYKSGILQTTDIIEN